MLSEAQENSLGEQEGRYAVFGDLHLLDKVSKALLATNKHHGRKASFSDMLNITQHKPGLKFLYNCNDRKWRCQIFVFDDYDREWLNIKLQNDSYEYAFKQGFQIKRHRNIPGWVRVDWEDLSRQLPTVSKNVDNTFDKVMAWYNHEYTRLDLQFYRPDPSDKVLPGLRITYKPGYPVEDDGEMPQHLKR